MIEALVLSRNTWVLLGLAAVALGGFALGRSTSDPGTIAGAESELERFLRDRPFLRNETDFYRYDEVVGHLHQPNAERERRWPEHHEGSFELRTNNLGFREDAPTSERKAPGSVRILVTGDSHTDGVVPNRESFANQLEDLLNERSDGTLYEVINGGVGHFGPYNYARFVDRFAELSPDLVIATVFLGNDFLDAARLLEGSHRFQNPRPRGYHVRLQSANEALRGAMGQGLNQIYYLKHFPEMKTVVLDFSVEQLVRMRESAARLGAPLLVLLLPTKLDVEREAQGEQIELAMELLELGEAHFEVSQDLGAALRGRLEQRGIAVVDLAPLLAPHAPGLYWMLDHHLNTRGHAVLARGLAERERARFEALAER